MFCHCIPDFADGIITPLNHSSDSDAYIAVRVPLKRKPGGTVSVRDPDGGPNVYQVKVPSGMKPRQTFLVSRRELKDNVDALAEGTIVRGAKSISSKFAPSNNVVNASRSMILVNVPPGAAPGTDLEVAVPGENRSIVAKIPAGVSNFYVTYEESRKTEVEAPSSTPNGEKIIKVPIPRGVHVGKTIHIQVPDEPGRVLAAEVPATGKEFYVTYIPNTGSSGPAHNNTIKSASQSLNPHTSTPSTISNDFNNIVESTENSDRIVPAGKLLNHVHQFAPSTNSNHRLNVAWAASANSHHPQSQVPNMNNYYNAVANTMGVRMNSVSEAGNMPRGMNGAIDGSVAGGMNGMIGVSATNNVRNSMDCNMGNLSMSSRMRGGVGDNIYSTTYPEQTTYSGAYSNSPILGVRMDSTGLTRQHRSDLYNRDIRDDRNRSESSMYNTGNRISEKQQTNEGSIFLYL